MKLLSWLLGTLAALLLIATLAMWAWAPWLHGDDCMRLFGTGFVVLMAAAICAVGSFAAWLRSEA